jgi:hypothetical protein
MTTGNIYKKSSQISEGKNIDQLNQNIISVQIFVSGAILGRCEKQCRYPVPKFLIPD